MAAELLSSLVREGVQPQLLAQPRACRKGRSRQLQGGADTRWSSPPTRRATRDVPCVCCCARCTPARTRSCRGRRGSESQAPGGAWRSQQRQPGLFSVSFRPQARLLALGVRLPERGTPLIEHGAHVRLSRVCLHAWKEARSVTTGICSVGARAPTRYALRAQRTRLLCCQGPLRTVMRDAPEHGRRGIHRQRKQRWTHTRMQRWQRTRPSCIAASELSSGGVNLCCPAWQVRPRLRDPPLFWRVGSGRAARVAGRVESGWPRCRLRRVGSG